MEKERKHYSAEEKVAILRRHLVEQVPVSELCDKQGLQRGANELSRQSTLA
jgi:transposase